jgi:hypothetical protein
MLGSGILKWLDHTAAAEGTRGRDTRAGEDQNYLLILTI